MGFNIVLIEPEIPTNTGNIGRLTLATSSTLHLVKPYGFEISDTRLKRAGLDYWKHIDLREYESMDEFFTIHKDKPMAFLSSHATQMHYDINFQEGSFLVFGKESVGLPKGLLAQNADSSFKIPLYSEHIRSLNLANAVAITLYEGIRQIAHR